MNFPDPTETFRQEARELLDELERCLLDLEKNPLNDDLINEAFRALHTIKGSGAMFGFSEVANFVHEFETAFDRVRKGKTAATPELIALALDAKDHIESLIATPEDPVPGGSAIVDALRALTEGAVQAPAASGEKAPAVEQADDIVAPAGGQGAGKRWRVKFYLPQDCFFRGTNPLLLLEEIAEIGACTITALTDRVPSISDIDPESTYLGWQVDIEGDDPTQELKDVFLFLSDGLDLKVEPILAEAGLANDIADNPAQTSGEVKTPATDVPEEAQAIAPEAASVRAAPAPRAPQEAQAAQPQKGKVAQPVAQGGMSMRVAAERLDELMDCVGELVIAQARLSQIAADSTDINLKTISEELERLSSGLRDTTMGIRMVPIGTIFSRFRRLVHDLSRELGKEIEFVTGGEETELDKTVIERLADPLVHLIRNSIDHGLESAGARIAAGKSAKGRVRLEAVYAGAEVAISVSDDGAGLNAERIRAKAEEAGLLAPEAKIAEHDLYQMIFAPGFSTAKEVTALSGRGVGMDVVKRTIDGLRGSIEMTSVPGRGTTATLRLPLTLAIIDGMLVRVGNGRYSIPLAAVEECVEMPTDPDSQSRGRSFLDIRGELVPYIKLREMFNTPGEPDPHQKVVIVSCGDSRVGLVVDQIIGNSQTVIKQLSKLHSGLKAFSGATILGDGSVALILDTVNLVGLGQAYEEQHHRDDKWRAA